MLLLAASFFGGCVGSTCGGIKALRFLIMYKQSRLEINQLVHPNAMYTIKVGNAPIQIERCARLEFLLPLRTVHLPVYLAAESDGL